MVPTGDLRKGQTIVLDGELMKIMEYNHVKQGRGTAFVRMTLRNVRTGTTTVKTFMAGEKFEPARLETRKVQFLYRDGDDFHFMDLATYEQPTVKANVLGNSVSYLKDNQELDLLTYQDEVIDVSLPTAVELQIADTDPGYKGDTASGGGKPATLETGLVVTVPFFLSSGDTVRVDTRTGEYIERVG